MFETNRNENRAKSYYGVRQSPFVAQHYDTWGLGLPFADKISVPVEQMPMILAVGGGKGGVGKSVISANMSAILASCGYRVLVVDLDLGCSNLHTNFGVTMPKKTLTDFLIGGKYSFDDILLPAPVQGVAFVAGGKEELWSKDVGDSRKLLTPLWEQVVQAKRKYKVDFVIFDLGAGTNRHTMDFFCSSHVGIATVLPEPTSIENAYVFLRTTLLNFLEIIGQKTNQVEAANEVAAALNNMNSKSLSQGYNHLLKQLAMSYPDLIDPLLRTLEARKLGLIVNQTRDQADMDIGRSMEHICQRYFGFDARYLTHLNHDDSVLKSIRNRRLLISDFPHSIISKRLLNAVSQVLGLLGLPRRF